MGNKFRRENDRFKLGTWQMNVLMADMKILIRSPFERLLTFIYDLRAWSHTQCVL